ncbi:CPBP family intramembrane glutamic endopeptidase [Cytobacillus purgationiresistens]|uniref:Membrane protease YdiL (CAAX protease family) n=1 Tax=Cytobacillus purgationiresistens TaxID=863449 RepID=A0ABU0ALI4_9BACI|nr:CPBP family intramembrane glutamic endopeptidase [Cytobacillus purgationiresistens]MDQ0272127.1 membrane protease YdiL (CAAX protease family) [Cytobacillus purgationiresistens]
MGKTKNIIVKIIGLELLLIVFYTINGAYMTIKEPSNPVMQFIGLVPLAAGVYIFLALKNKWGEYFFTRTIRVTKSNLLLIFPLFLVLLIIFFGNKGLNTSSISDLIYMFFMQLLIVAFIEETFFRGMIYKLLLGKGAKLAVLISSLLFGITHSLQLLGGQSIEDTLVQIAYAFLVGLVLSLLIVHQQSILITISFHGLNNFLNFMGKEEGSNTFAYIIIAVFFIYACYLWMRMNKTEC